LLSLKHKTRFLEFISTRTRERGRLFVLHRQYKSHWVTHT